MSDDESLREREPARIERDVVHLLDESRAIRTTLHSLIAGALQDHATALAKLASAHDERRGMWWALIAAGAVLVAIAGAIAWIVEHQVQIIVKP